MAVVMVDVLEDVKDVLEVAMEHVLDVAVVN